MLSLNNNRFYGKVPEIWSSPSCFINLEYLSIKENHLGDNIYPMPILHGAQNLQAIDFSLNKFNGSYPVQYFSKDAFHHLQYVAANFNKGTEVPDICIRQAFCYKKVLQQGRNANDMNFLEQEIIDIIYQSDDVFMYK